jgi:hypothetical protein
MRAPTPARLLGTGRMMPTQRNANSGEHLRYAIRKLHYILKSRLSSVYRLCRSAELVSSLAKLVRSCVSGPWNAYSCVIVRAGCKQ